MHRESMIADLEGYPELHPMSEFEDIPLDVPLTREGVAKYRYARKLEDDIAFSQYQRRMFNKEFHTMAEQFLNNITGQPMIFCSKKESPSDFHMQRAKVLSNVCLTAKEPFSQGSFMKIPTVLHEKILTYLSGLGVLHTRAL